CLAAMYRVAQRRGLTSEVQREERGYTRGRERVSRGEGSPDAQRDQNATDGIGRDERCDHRRIRDAVIGQADGRARLDGRATPSRLLDRRASRAIAGGAEGFGRLWLPYGTPPRDCRARCHGRVLGDISIRADGVTRQTRVRLCECLCTLFDAEHPSPSMKMRPMPRGRLITLVPFALVSALAVGVALAGYIASPHAPPTSARVGTSSSPANA